MKLAIALLTCNLLGCATGAGQPRTPSHAVVRDGDGAGAGATTNTGSGSGGTPIPTPHPNV